MSVELSIVSPVYGASSLLEKLVNTIKDSVSPIVKSYEIILVEDNSPDNSWQIISDIVKNDNHVIGIKLSRNFGQQNAINAGLDYAKGNFIVTIDCDLQDDPMFIRELYAEALKGNDIVFASRQSRKDGFFKKTGSVLFYRLLGYLTETKQDHSIGNFIMYSRKVVEAMSKLGDYYRYYPMINRWVGFSTVTLPIKHQERLDNKSSSYSYRKRFRLAFTTIIAFSDKPLRLVLKFGALLILLSLAGAVLLIVNYAMGGKVVSGWLSIFISVWFLSGIIIMTLGLIGTYLGKMFESVKKRPTYLIQEIIKT